MSVKTFDSSSTADPSLELLVVERYVRMAAANRDLVIAPTERL
jgi:hypothetical protein